MASRSQQTKGVNDVLSRLNTDIEDLYLAKNVRDIPSARTAFCSVSALLTVIRVRSRLFYDDY